MTDSSNTSELSGHPAASVLFHKEVPNLRIAFVQMLFALSIGQVALKVGDLIYYSKEGFLSSLYDYPYVYSHLLLCVIILTCSFVGWQISQSLDNSEKINFIGSLQYIILLVDISLVICYFIMYEEQKLIII